MYVSSTFRDSCNLRIVSFSIIGNSVKQEPVGVSIKMESDSRANEFNMVRTLCAYVSKVL